MNGVVFTGASRPFVRGTRVGLLRRLLAEALLARRHAGAAAQSEEHRAQLHCAIGALLLSPAMDAGAAGDRESAGGAASVATSFGAMTAAFRACAVLLLSREGEGEGAGEAQRSKARADALENLGLAYMYATHAQHPHHRDKGKRRHLLQEAQAAFAGALELAPGQTATAGNARLVDELLRKEWRLDVRISDN